MAGRSNVGKSTLLNALCRSKIARTSAAPGKTRLANIYRVTVEGGGPGRWGLYLVDLPGYGYARGGADAAEELRAVAEAYFLGARDSGLGARTSGSARRRLRSRAPSPEPRIPTRFTPGRQPPPGIESGHSGGALAGRDGRGLPRRRDEDRQTVAHRARAQHEGARTYFRQDRRCRCRPRTAKDWTYCGKRSPAWPEPVAHERTVGTRRRRPRRRR